MPRITPKSEATLQAQTAAFAAERITRWSDKAYLINHIGEIAAAPLKSVKGRIKKYGADFKDVAEYHHIASPDGYTDFLRDIGGSKADRIAGRKSILNAYDSFRSLVAHLKSQLDDTTNYANMPDHLGNGSNSHVFKIELNGSKYAVRIPNEDEKANTIDTHIAGAVLGADIPHMEHIIAASYEDGVTIAELMPGREVEELTIEEITQITPVQLTDLVETVRQAHERGILIDPKPSNFFYDTSGGFGIVDYKSSFEVNEQSTDQTLGTMLGWMHIPILNAGRSTHPSERLKTIEDYTALLPVMKANVKNLEMFKQAIVDANIPKNDKLEALRVINQNIEPRRVDIENYSDTSWIIKEIEKDNAPPRKITDEEFNDFM